MHTWRCLRFQPGVWRNSSFDFSLTLFDEKKASTEKWKGEKKKHSVRLPTRWCLALSSTIAQESKYKQCVVVTSSVVNSRCAKLKLDIRWHRSCTTSLHTTREKRYPYSSVDSKKVLAWRLLTRQGQEAVNWRDRTILIILILNQIDLHYCWCPPLWFCLLRNRPLVSPH